MFHALHAPGMKALPVAKLQIIEHGGLIVLRLELP
jgi:hypothetical protein